MNDIEPLSDSLKGLLKNAQLVPPPEAMSRVKTALQTSIAALPVVAPVAPPVSSGAAAVAKVATGKVAGLAVSTLLIGVAGGIVLGRTVWAPAPVVQERVVRVEVPVPVKTEPPPDVPSAPVEPTVAPPVQNRAPVKPVKEQAAAPVISNDEAMRQEQELLELARVALLRRDTATALKALSQHAAKFAAGQLTEERESMAIQALVIAGDHAAAAARLEAFEKRFPHSMLKPSLEAE